MQKPLHAHVRGSTVGSMSLPAPSLTSLARRKAAMTRHYGPDDSRTVRAASDLRMARLLAEIEAGLSDGERAELMTALAGASA